MPKSLAANAARSLPAIAGIAAIALVLVAAYPPPPPPPDAPVADAAQRGDVVALRALVRQGADVNEPQGDGMTALHWAATLGRADIAQTLIVAGARTEAVTRNANYTPLHLAARAGHAPVTEVLLDAGANIDARTSSGGALPLHFAAANGSVQTIAALLDRGAPVDSRENAWQQTPLMWAAAANRVDAIKLLTLRGADLCAVSSVEILAVRERADRAARDLRNRRQRAALEAVRTAAQPAARGNGPGGQAAPAAARRDSAARPAAETAAPGPATPTPARAGSDSAGRGATRTRGGGGRRITYSGLVGQQGGLTALHFAVREGHEQAVLALIQAGAELDHLTEGDHTSPLLLAIINGHFDIARELLARGADPRLASDNGDNPLYATLSAQWAPHTWYPQVATQHVPHQKTGYLDLMEALLKAGADPNSRLTKHLWYTSFNADLLGVGTGGATPFWRAAYATDVRAMRLLVAHGADPSIPTAKPAGTITLDPNNAPPVDSTDAPTDPSGLPPVPDNGPAVYPIHAAAGVGYGEGYAGNAHVHAPDGWMPAMRFLVDEMHADVNARDLNGFTPLHHAAARGDNEMILYLVSKGADVRAIARRGQTVADMANGPVQRIPPFLETVALLERLGSKNSNKCRSC